MMKRLTPLLLLLVPLFGTAAEKILLDQVVAVVNEDIVTQQELDRTLRTVRQQVTARGGRLPGNAVLRSQVMERVVMESIQLQLARRMGISIDDLTLDRTIQRIAQQNRLTMGQFRDVLARDGVSMNDFREDVRRELTVSRLRKRQVNDRINISEREIDEHLLRNADRDDPEREYLVRHILVAIPDGSTPDQIDARLKRAEGLMRDLNSGKDFSELAITASDSENALEGGDLGWRKAGQIPTIFVDRVLTMEVGESAGPIRSPSGYHLIQLADVRGGEKHIVKQTRARHILIRPDELVTAQMAQTRLEQLRARIQQGDDFADLAKANSQDSTSAINGGELPWAGPGTFAPQFEEAMGDLEPGDISPPFQTQFGWHIVQVLERREHDDTDSYRRARARDQIFKRKVEEETQQWLRRLRDEAFVEIRQNPPAS